ncbi:metalloprotease TldD [Fangia hongkongensis]|uniref:metalloprotease TldD n=1 Tax=Fangia hongkongensis TaxID=270495 RepID=UPI00037D1018|nr:metalloprotease TldD [Fangia hongkongensis]MBK2123684.1 metalloprotease TldD [Fangia hongkongensis]
MSTVIQNQDYYSIIEAHLLTPFRLTLTNLNDVLAKFHHKEIDFGDIYLQKSISEGWVLEDDVVKHGSFSIEQGVGVRGVYKGETGFAYSDDLKLDTISKLIDNALYLLKDAKKAKGLCTGNTITAQRLYSASSPLDSLNSNDKVHLLKEVNAYAKAKDSRIEKVSASLSGSYEIILLMDTMGLCMMDVRPLVRMNVDILMEDGHKRESFSSGGGGRYDYQYFLENDLWKEYVDEAYFGAKTNLQAKPAPSGVMPVVLGSGWPAVLLHEAVGHGLEGDFNRKETSHFSNKIGQKVASSKCTVIDEGSIANRRGSLSFDDEGTPTQKTTLIEKGILKGYIHDRISAKAMNAHPTGNGRRESYAHPPLPRMTNTYMLPGEDRFEDMIASIDHGVYATHFNGGQVDITSGQFVFVMDQAYLIEKGKITHPVKGASLIGHGPEVMQQISMVGADFSLDKGVGVCGKDGQSVPVGVGQATLKVDAITIGGMES